MSKGLFDQMEADADAFNSVDTEGGSVLSSLIREAQRQSETVAEHEELAKQAKVEYQRIVRELIPAEMERMGLDRVDVDGNSVSIKPFVYATIPESRKEEAFNFLRSIGEDDIIKNEVKVTFGKGQDNRAGALFGELQSQGLDPEQRQAVHPSTLKAWIKDRMAAGKEIDLEMFGAYIGTEATIRRK